MPDLFDISLRRQLYIEGFKDDSLRLAPDLIIKVETSVNRALKSIGNREISDLNKGELQALLVKISKGLGEILNSFSIEFFAFLRKFMKVDQQLSLRVFASYFASPDKDNIKPLSIEKAIQYTQDNYEPSDAKALLGVSSALSVTALWKRIKNLTLQTNGLTLQKYLQSYFVHIANQITGVVSRAWSNKLATRELLENLFLKSTGALGGFTAGSASVFKRLTGQLGSIIETAIGFVSSMVSSAVSSTFVSQYMWNSILDTGTTDVCVSRHANVYNFGDGPLPPAHAGCRSSIVPIEESSSYDNNSFADWFKGQPSALRGDVGDYANRRFKPRQLKLKSLPSKINLILT